MTVSTFHAYRQPITGDVALPGDKSISHRAAIFGAIAEGQTTISNFLMGEDCLSTLSCLKALGADVSFSDKNVVINGKGWDGLQRSENTLFVGNSGTTIRLLSGLLSGQPFTSVLDGDSSIRKRPMDRVTIPLAQMGAAFDLTDQLYAPLSIEGGSLQGITYNSPVASAQVKSAVLLAGLQASGKTVYTEPHLSRDHTERMISAFGGEIEREEERIVLKGKQLLKGQDIEVPGDFSSAAFLIAAAAITPGSKLHLKNVGINPTRTGFLDILQKMGADITLHNQRQLNGEPVSDLTIHYAPLSSVTIEGGAVPKMIDEFPIFSLLASHASGQTIIKDAGELKVKETNRIAIVVKELSEMGADITETSDGMIIQGDPERVLRGGNVNSHHDHRIAMMLTVASQLAENPVHVKDSECMNISFPGFIELFKSVR